LSHITQIGSKNYGLECDPKSYLNEESEILAILRSGLQTSKEENQQEEGIIKDNDLKIDYDNMGN
jgi:hypothetical protein